MYSGAMGVAVGIAIFFIYLLFNWWKILFTVLFSTLLLGFISSLVV